MQGSGDLTDRVAARLQARYAHFTEEQRAVMGPGAARGTTVRDSNGGLSSNLFEENILSGTVAFWPIYFFLLI